MKKLTNIVLVAMLSIPGDALVNSYNPEIYSAPPKSAKSTTITIDPEQELISRINSEYQEHKQLVDNWIDIMKFPMGKRAIINKWTIDIVDTIQDNRTERRRYSSKMRQELKSAGGRDEITREAYERFDKYRNIFDDTFSKYGMPRELTYLPITESNVSAVKSKVGAQGYWQIMKSTKGDLVINNIVDERNSIVRSTERAAKKLRGLHALFDDYRFDATCYIMGEYGVTTDLEKMLNIEKKGKFFSSYSSLVYFHAPRDHKILSKENFWKQTRKLINSRSRIFNADVLKDNYKHRNDAEPPEGLYENYLNDVIDSDSVYVKSFWNYYGLDVNRKELYWKYNEFLKTTKNNFDTPNYVPRLIAAIMLHNSDFKYDRQKPLIVKEFVPTKDELKQLYSDNLFRELNMHIKPKVLKSGKIPPNTKVYKAYNY